MAIFDETGQQDTITGGWPALELFTDRHDAIRLFASYLNDDPPRRSVLFFYGDGGNGKSLLLKYLIEHHRKRLSAGNWEFVRDCPAEDFEGNLRRAEGAAGVPFALLDFGMTPVGDDRPLEAFSGLLMLRRALAYSAREEGRRLPFPLFDFACLWYLHKTGGIDAGSHRRLFPAEEMEFVGEVVNALSQTSWGTLAKTILGVFGKHSGEWYTLYSRRRGLGEDDLLRIQRMDPQSELIDYLPQLFAEDLNVAMAGALAPPALLLAFDTHEGFWGHRRALSDDLFFQRDEWLRRLLGTLELSAGIVAVVAGRDRPRWAEASRYKIPEEYIETFLVGHLPEADALDYLERAGVADAAVRRALADYARVEPGHAHPLYLGLCADVVMAAARKGVALAPEDFRSAPQAADKREELIARLLRYVDVEIATAIRALSACRAFDLDLYLRLGEEFRFSATEPAFRGVLTRFSFVWPVQRTDEREAGQRYRVHELLRRLLRESDDEAARRAHEFLWNHYLRLSEAGDLGARAEAVYHLNRLDWQRGVAEWLTFFDYFLDKGQYDKCGALLGVRRELLTGSHFALARVAHSAGLYFIDIGRYEEAGEELLDAVRSYDEALRQTPWHADAHHSKGNALIRLGGLQVELAQFEDAIENMERAVAAFGEVLSRAPDNVMAIMDKGSALTTLGITQTIDIKYDEASASFKSAVALYDQALRLAPSHVGHSNRAFALRGLGDLQAAQGLDEESVESYESALAACEVALKIAPYDRTHHLNRGLILRTLGEAQAKLSRAGEAEESYRAALTACGEALRLAPDFLVAYQGHAAALLSLGELHAAGDRYDEAARSYERAADACDETLRRGPDLVSALHQKGQSLLRLGEVRAAQSRHEEAVGTCLRAVAAFDEEIERAPGKPAAHQNKGFALNLLAKSQLQLGRHEEAADSYARAVEAYEEVLRHAPGEASVHNSKGDCLFALGDLRPFGDAVGLYERAAAAYEEALGHEPDRAPARQNLGVAFMRLGEAHASTNSPGDAVLDYRKAVAALDEDLKHAPADSVTLYNKGYALTRLGELLNCLTRYEEASSAFGEAVAALGLLTSREPDDVKAHTAKGLAYARLTETQKQRGLPGEASASSEAAASACEEAMRLAPGEVEPHNIKAIALQHLGELLAGQSRRDEACEKLRAARAEFSRALELAPDDSVVRANRDSLQKVLEEVCETELTEVTGE